MKLASQHESALVVGPDHFGDGSVFGNEDNAVPTLTNVDADAAQRQSAQSREAAAHIGWSENKAEAVALETDAHIGYSRQPKTLSAKSSAFWDSNSTLQPLGMRTTT